MSNNGVWSESFAVATSDGLSLHAVAAGPSEAPVVVLVHGFPDSLSVWDGVAAQLSKQWRVVAYDVRGAGGSDAPTSRAGYDMQQLSDDLFRVVAAVSPHRKVHLVAHDWGSIQSWESITEPTASETFASYTTVSGPCLDHVGHALRAMPRHKPMAAVRQAFKSWYVYAFHVPKLPELVWRTSLAQRLFGPSDSLAKDGGNGVELYRANMRKHLLHPRERRTSVPVQVIVPLKDRYVSPALTAELELWASDVCRREIDAGHWVVRTHAEAIADAIWSFAAQHAQAA